MRIAVVGSRHLGAAVLGDLAAAGHELAGVVAPDAADRLAQAAASLSVPLVTLDGRICIEPDDVGTGVDLIVAAHCHAVVSDAALLRRSRLGGIGYHPSLLPRHRGRAAVEWTIRSGDAIAGGSVYQLTADMDAGPIAAQEWCHVRPGETARDLWERALCPMGRRLLGRVVADAAASGRIVAVPQDGTFATWAHPVRVS